MNKDQEAYRQLSEAYSTVENRSVVDENPQQMDSVEVRNVTTEDQHVGGEEGAEEKAHELIRMFHHESWAEDEDIPNAWRDIIADTNIDHERVYDLVMNNDSKWTNVIGNSLPKAKEYLSRVYQDLQASSGLTGPPRI